MTASLRYPDVTAHELIAETCVGMAETIYEDLCSGSNAIYKVHADRKDFIRQCAPTLKAAARAVLAALLSDPMTSTIDKERIHDALCLDAMLPNTGSSMVKRGLSYAR